VPFRDGEFNITLMLKAYGGYTFRVKDPIAFFTNIAANVSDTYEKATIEKQMKTEMQSAMLPLIGGLAKKGIRYDEIPLLTDEIVSGLNEALNDKWSKLRGLELVSLVITGIVPDETSVEKIRQFQESAIYADQTQMLGARLGVAQANAMQDAANNSGGAMTGFVGMNMAGGMANGINAGELLRPQNKNEAAAGKSAAPEEWVCSCGQRNVMLYCQECGKKRPEPKKPWICSCGQENTMKFCGSCGKRRPKRLVCDKCGYELEMSALPPKFCPQCGDPIDEKDEVDD
jgi:membrane protease subunit (stomatin/prohibitin family)